MKLPRALLVLALTTVCSLAACATATPRGKSVSGDGSQLSKADLENSNASSLYDAISKLRPSWLASRGPSSVTNSTPTAVDVYMDGNFLGQADYLRDVRISDATAVRYWDAGQASVRFGMGHPRGVIEVIRK